MLIVIISDIHDNLEDLNKCLAWCRENSVQKIICCGDVARAETIGALANGFRGEIFLVRGNMEIYEEEDLAGYENINYAGESGRAEIDGLKIGFCHEPYKISGVLKNAVQAGDTLGFVFYGHTHKPWLEKRGAATVANPGCLASGYQTTSFAVLDTTTKKLELKIVNNL